MYQTIIEALEAEAYRDPNFFFRALEEVAP